MEVLRRYLLRRASRDEQGFGLLELVIASTVMMTALSSMAFVTTNAFSDIAMARERQTANALLDEAIERLRALPYDTVSLGMRTSDLAGDPRVLGAGTAASPYRLATSNERIVHVSTNVTVEPLVPNVTSRTVDNIVYAVRVYLTHFQDDPTTGAVTATAYVDWFSHARRTGNAFMRTSTVIFSPAAANPGSSAQCVSTAVHPFAGPCLAFTHGVARVKPGVTTIVGGSTTVTLDTPGASSAVEQEQTAVVHGWATGNGVTTIGGATNATAGYATSSSQADNDPAADDVTPYDIASGSSAGPVAVTGPLGSATVTTSFDAGATFETVSTTAATADNDCWDIAGTPLLDSLSCGRSRGDQLGSATTSVSLDWLGAGLGSMEIVKQSATSVATHVNRDTTPGGGVCTSTTSSTGCTHAKASRTISSIALGGVPSSLKPIGFSNLVELTGYSDSVSAEAGISAAAPTTSAAGTLRYWNGLTYTSVSFAALSGNSLPVAALTVSSGVISIRVTTALQAGSSSTTDPGTTTCLTSLACRTRGDASRTSPLRGTMSYEISSLGVPVLAFTMSVDFGDLTASASYTDPPLVP